MLRLSVTAFLTLCAVPAFAQEPPRKCQDFATLAASAGRFGLEVIASGPTSGDTAMILYRARGDHSWLVLEVTPAGKACVIGTGSDLEVMVPAAAPGSAG